MTDLATVDGRETLLKNAPGSVVVSLGGSSTWGVMKHVGEDFFEEHGRPSVSGTRRTVLVATGKLPTLAQGAFPTVDGVQYHVKDLMPENDGLETRVFLGKVEDTA